MNRQELIARVNIRSNEIKNQLWLMTIDNSPKALKNAMQEVDTYCKDIIALVEEGDKTSYPLDIQSANVNGYKNPENLTESPIV